MRKMRKFLNILFLCTLALGLSSCEPDDGEDYYIYDTLLGGIWVGDLGFADAYNSPLESGLYFEGNGLGRDEQAYYNDPYGEVAFSLPFRWAVRGWLRNSLPSPPTTCCMLPMPTSVPWRIKAWLPHCSLLPPLP